MSHFIWYCTHDLKKIDDTISNMYFLHITLEDPYLSETINNPGISSLLLHGM